MKNLAFAVAAALSVGACASTDGANGTGARASAASGTQYCWQNRLVTANGKHQCNWAGSRNDACEGAQVSSVDAALYSAPRKGTMCANGQWLVELAPA